jgi:prepilin peptidase CpaA
LKRPQSHAAALTALRKTPRRRLRHAMRVRLKIRMLEWSLSANVASRSDEVQVNSVTVRHLLMLFPLVALLAYAAVEDVRRRRIPNWLTFSLVLAGLGMGAMTMGAGSLWNAFLGLLVGFGATLVLHMLGALGAGDVKLMAGVGAWIGPRATIIVLAGASVVGMLLAIVQSARHRRLKGLFRDSALLSLHLLRGVRAGAITPADTAAREAGNKPAAVDPAKRPLPFAVAVFSSTAIAMTLSLIGGFGKWVMVP